MIYFKKVFFEPTVTHQQVEKALRRFALKRLTTLDFKSSTSDFKSEKYFLGYQGKSSLQFTRIRTSFEKVLPKLIISLSNSPENFYKVRLSLIWMAFFSLFAFFYFFAIVSLVIGEMPVANFVTSTIFLGTYFSLIFLELKFTKVRVLKAITESATLQEI